METIKNFWSYHAQFFLEWEMFQENVEKKTRIWNFFLSKILPFTI